MVNSQFSTSLRKRFKIFPNWEQVHSANSGTKKPGLLGLREIEAKKIEVETSMGKNKKKYQKKGLIFKIVLFLLVFFCEYFFI